jgi:hypothetical protein
VVRRGDDLVVVAQRHERVDWVPARHDIGDARIKGQPVQRRMRLDETPVPLLG